MPWPRSVPATAAMGLRGHICLALPIAVGGTGRNARCEPIPGVGGRQAANLQMAMGWLAERTALGDNWEVPQAPETALKG